MMKNRHSLYKSVPMVPAVVTLLALSMGMLGCELVASVDRGQIGRQIDAGGGESGSMSSGDDAAFEGDAGADDVAVPDAGSTMPSADADAKVPKDVASDVTKDVASDLGSDVANDMHTPPDAATTSDAAGDGGDTSLDAVAD